MFKSNSEINNSNDTIIGPTVNVEGELASEGNILIDGNVKGSISTSNSVQISQNAKINATIKAKNAKIAGTIIGDLQISEQLEITATANIKGNITTNTLSIEKGAMINGNINCSKDKGGVLHPEKLK